MFSRTPDAKIAVLAPCSEIFILKFIERYNLNDFAIMCSGENVVLAHFFKTKNDKVSFSKARYQEICFLSSNRHGVQWLMRFDSVSAAL